jgi:hypothetical protein
VSFGFYHFACIMLRTYRPGPKFAVYNAASLSDANVGIYATHVHEYLTDQLYSKRSSSTLAKSVAHASARQRRFPYQLQSAIPSLSGDR